MADLAPLVAVAAAVVDVGVPGVAVGPLVVVEHAPVPEPVWGSNRPTPRHSVGPKKMEKNTTEERANNQGTPTQERLAKGAKEEGKRREVEKENDERRKEETEEEKRALVTQFDA